MNIRHTFRIMQRSGLLGQTVQMVLRLVIYLINNIQNSLNNSSQQYVYGPTKWTWLVTMKPIQPQIY